MPSCVPHPKPDSQQMPMTDVSISCTSPLPPEAEGTPGAIRCLRTPIDYNDPSCVPAIYGVEGAFMSTNRFKKWIPSSFLNQCTSRCVKIHFLGAPTAGAIPTDFRWRNLVSAWVSLRNTTRQSLGTELDQETAHAPKA